LARSSKQETSSCWNLTSLCKSNRVKPDHVKLRTLTIAGVHISIFLIALQPSSVHHRAGFLDRQSLSQNSSSNRPAIVFISGGGATDDQRRTEPTKLRLRG
jgi:hypothetical protein